MQVRPYATDDFAGVRDLWEAAFPDDAPWNRAEAAIPAKLAVQPDLLLVAVIADDRRSHRVVGTVMAGYDGHRGWLYSVAVHPEARRGGIGTALVREAERRLHAIGCGKVNLQVRTTNAAVVGFYRALGYAVEERISLGKRL